MVLGAMALLLIGLSLYTSLLDPLRAKLGVLTQSAYWVTDIPTRFGDWMTDRLTSKQALLEENAALREELLIHKGRAQQMATIYAENMRLQQLMNASEKVNERVLIAEIFGVSPDPLAHRVIINRGSEHGVYVGQPLLDADGLMGQVVEVSPYSSQVLLITDSSHAIPVQVNRNGVRAVAEGIGNLYQLELRHVSNTVDIQEGDLLVSSGLGQRFPVGYPVAEVETVIHDPGQPFARVIARPMAQLNRSRHVLLVFNDPARADSPADLSE
ncbi:rod shape-determining protein MreC [Proteobacteria bacterium 005FR1]|nr:rod shape-determining protein MreC [Proteobacteria bacterium 005FR1]